MIWSLRGAGFLLSLLAQAMWFSARTHAPAHTHACASSHCHAEDYAHDSHEDDHAHVELSENASHPDGPCALCQLASVPLETAASRAVVAPVFFAPRERSPHTPVSIAAPCQCGFDARGPPQQPA